MKNVDDIVKKDNNGLLQMDNTLKSKKFKDFLNAPAQLEKLSKQGKDKSLQKETITNFDRLNEAEHWITGIHLHGQDTEAQDGLISGWDVDWGEMVALGGKLMPVSEYREQTGKIPIRQEETGEEGNENVPSPEDNMSQIENVVPPESEPVAEPVEESTEMPGTDVTTQEMPGTDVTVQEEIVDDVTVEDLYGLENFEDEDDARPFMKHAGRHKGERQKMDRTNPSTIYENYLNWDKEILDEFCRDNGLNN